MKAEPNPKLVVALIALDVAATLVAMVPDDARDRWILAVERRLRRRRLRKARARRVAGR